MIAAVVAKSKNNVIGVKNDLPWDLSADRKYFRDVTSGHTVIMGRKTAESIIARLGHGLPNRRNIVLTRNREFVAEGFTVAHSVDEAIALAEQGDIYIIGGEQIYELALPYCDQIHVTEVDATIEDGDAFFDVDLADWHEVSRDHHEKDDKNQYDFDIVVFDRKK